MPQCRSISLLLVAVFVIIWCERGAFAQSAPGLCTGCSCGRISNFRGKRMVGGSTASTYPWLATVIGTNITAGALISRRHVITAASPLSGLSASSLRVALGPGNSCSSTGGTQSVSVSSIQIHPNYDSTTGQADIAILDLGTTVYFSSAIQHVCLPPAVTSGYQTTTVQIVSAANGTSAFPGNTTACQYQMQVQPIRPLSVCSSTGVGSQYVTSDRGCFGNTGVNSTMCASDAGGLVLYNSGNFYILIGILPSINNCSLNGPSLFTRTAPLLRWILQVTSNSCYCSVYG